MKKYRIIVCGGRDFKDWELLRIKLNAYTLFLEPINEIEIVCGGCEGADRLAEIYAENHNLPIRIFKADWDKHGKAAGPIRNKRMAAYGTHLIAFWNGSSPGTRDMIKAAKRAGIPDSQIKVVRYDKYH